jgi:hypothetical protein
VNWIEMPLGRGVMVGFCYFGYEISISIIGL